MHYHITVATGNGGIKGMLIFWWGGKVKSSIFLLDRCIQFDYNSDEIVDSLVNGVLKSGLDVNDLVTENPLLQMELDIIRSLLKKNANSQII